MQRSGLEWLHRLGQEPRRLGRRYLIDGLPFAASLLAKSAWRRVRRPAA
jgi:N-acetylglucosaminyldiphosphoundecaprenol N-acetyl-beta-D-mannosaminyltransferase